MEYIAKINHEEDGFTVEFPDIPGCYTCGDTLEEALTMAEDALYAILYAKLEDKDPLPRSTLSEDQKNGFYAIQVNGRLALAYTIFEARRGKSAASICKKMGIAPQQYKLEDPKAGITFATLEKFAKAIGKKLEIKFV
ncbi:MAG: type II toxin-antitoxin system HicB family antitoxin [Fibrobacter sp.]|nr:type II toxin-antitoxin system HicB family antitoxin [Fibrobacter sp.]